MSVRRKSSILSRYTLFGVLLALLIQGCAVAPSSVVRLPESPPESVELLTMRETQFTGVPINVSVIVFDGVAQGESSSLNAINQVRSVERRYLPYQLKQTLDQTNHWGAVRVMPGLDPGAELNVSGAIVQSDGIHLVLHIMAQDATGRVWLDQTFEDRAGDLDYAVDPDYRIDPFQDIFNNIANELIKVRQSFSESDTSQLIDITMLRYASDLSEAAFDRYVAESDGRFTLQGLPAQDDPLFTRIQKIRESEYLFSDAVDAHYESLQQRLGPTYAWWRYYSFDLIQGNRRLEGVDATRGATRGSWYAMERIYKTYKESKMNEDALRELSESFDRETAPTVAELSGRVFRLTGTLEKQYKEWRSLLQQMLIEERGL